MKKAILTALTLATALSTAPAARAAARDPYVELLEKYGVTADAGSLGDYLRSLHPGPETTQRVAALIRQMGDDDYHRREAAMNRLLRSPVLSPELLHKAAESDDPEIAWRAAYVLRHADQRWDQVVYAAFHVIHRQKITGLAEAVLAALPLCGAEPLREMGCRALKATAEPADADRLRRKLGADNDPQLRAAAVAALEQALGEESGGDLRPLLAETDDRVRLAAARALANHGDRRALPVLGRLLDSEDVKVRIRAVQTLRELTEKTYQFDAGGDPQHRAATAKAWQTWIDAEGATAKLHYPLKDTPVMLGRTLICCYTNNRLFELDAQGKTTWELSIAQPWSAQGLPNGHRLIASYGTRTVVEYDAAGNEVWKKTGLSGNPGSARRLPDGNTLIALGTTAQRVIEVNRAGETVWSVPISGQPMDARRLPHGNTLVALQTGNRVVELDRSGKVVWELPNMLGAFSARRLPNGNTLVAQTSAGRVVEVDRDKHVVWSKTGLRIPYDAQRLPGGNTLIVDGTGVQEVDPKGNFVRWIKQGGGMLRVCRY